MTSSSTCADRPLSLNAVETGSGRPIVILHGLFGAAQNWLGIAKALASRFRVLALDARNHGASPWAERCDYHAMARDVAWTLGQHDVDRCVLIGHSMGGKTAMTLALTTPHLVERLVVVDIAPARYEPRVTGLVAAMQQVDPGSATRRSDVDAALAPLVPDAGVRLFLLQNLAPDEGGGYRWKLNLGALRAGIEDLAGFPAFPAAAVYPGRALFMAGARSDYVRPEHRPLIEKLFLRSRIAAVPEAGHWVHADNPAGFLACLDAFLAEDPNQRRSTQP